jgi:rhomboid family GlyGly-CTERM serine protease
MKLFSNHNPKAGTQNPSRYRLYELAVWTIFLTAINFPLLTGTLPERFIFDLQMVKTGQLWRIFTYPFAHVSVYHLLLDAIAFLMIYNGLEEKNILKRLLHAGACGTGSLLLSLACSPAIGTTGLSGLSGIAHGLTAVTSLELLKNHKREPALFRVGIMVLSVVTIKSIVEVCTEKAFFSSFHLGYIGIPVVESHLGGVIGGIVSFLILNRPGEVCGSGIKISGVKNR